MVQYEQVSLYQEKPLKQLYFIAGAAYLTGRVVGGLCGLVHSLRHTRGKPRGMAYLAASMSESLGRSMALSAATLFTSRYLLEKMVGS